MQVRLFALLVLVLLSLGLISNFSEFEIAPQGFVPSIRQVLLLTPVGLFQNYFSEADPVWRQVYEMASTRAANLLSFKVLLPYLATLALALTGLTFLRRL